MGNTTHPCQSYILDSYDNYVADLYKLIMWAKWALFPEPVTFSSGVEVNSNTFDLTYSANTLLLFCSVTVASLTTSATTSSYVVERSSFSNWGSCVDIFAPVSFVYCYNIRTLIFTYTMTYRDLT